MIKCGLCGASLVAHFSKQPGRNMMDRYACVTGPVRPGCGKIAASKSSVDRYVLAQFFDFMSGVELLPADADERTLAEIQADITEAEASIARLSRNQYVTHDPKLPDDVFSSTINELSDHLDALRRAQLSAEDEPVLHRTALRPGSREDIEAWWGEASLPEQRAALQRAISKIVVKPATRRGNVFDIGRIEIHWSGLIYRAGAEFAKRWELTATPEQWAEAVDERTVDEGGNEYEIRVSPT